MVWGIVKHETGTQEGTWCHAEEFELTSEGSGQFMKDLSGMKYLKFRQLLLHQCGGLTEEGKLVKI